MIKSESDRLLLLEYKNKIQEEQLEKINVKLDELLTLRSKGIGAFWLASALLGTGIIGFIVLMIDWVKGLH